MPELSLDSAVGTVANDSVARSAARFTQDFYDWYRRRDDRLETAVRNRPSVLSSDLLAALRADIEAQSKSPGGIVGLDWDPFTASQDPCDPYKVSRTTRRGDTILVSMKGTGRCAPRPGPDVIAEVRRSRTGWVFVNFRYPHGSLLDDLANLRRARGGS